MAFSIERTLGEATDIARDAERYRADLTYLEDSTEDLQRIAEGIKSSWMDGEAIEATLRSVADERDHVEGMRQSALEEAKRSRAGLETLREDTETAHAQTIESRQCLEQKSQLFESSGLSGVLNDAIAEATESESRLKDLEQFLDETASKLDDIIDSFGSPDIGYDEEGSTDAGEKLKNEAMGKVVEGIAAAESLVLDSVDESIGEQQFSGVVGQINSEEFTLEDITSFAQERGNMVAEAMSYTAVDADARDYQAEIMHTFETQGNLRDMGLGVLAGIGLAAQGVKNLRRKK